LSKENESAAKRRKKRQPFTRFRYAGLPCAAQNNRALPNSLRSDSPRAYLIISLLPGCVKWSTNNHCELIKNETHFILQRNYIEYEQKG